MQPAVVVCGLGQVGYRVVSLLLDLGEAVTVITLDAKPEWKRDVETRGARVLMGDATDATILQQADLANAKAVIACSNVEMVNIGIAMDVKAIRPDMRLILRVFDHALAKNVEENLGVECAFAMSTIAAPAFAEAAVGEQIAASFELEGKRFSISRHDLTQAGPVRGKTPSELEKEQGISVLAFLHPERGIETPADDTCLEGDAAFVFGEDDALSRLTGIPIAGVGRDTWRPWHVFGFFRRLWSGVSHELKTIFVALNILVVLSVGVFWYWMDLTPMDAIYFVVSTVTTTGYGDITPREAPVFVKLFAIALMLMGSAMIALIYSIVTDYIVHARLQQLVGRQRIPERGHVVVAGLGNVGFRIVQELLRKNVRLAAIEQDPNGRFVETIRVRAPVLIGDAREPETLLRAGVAHCVAIVAATADDASNLSIGLTAAKLAPHSKRVLRIFDADFAAKIQQTFEIDVAMSASRIAAANFVAAALYGRTLAAFVHDGHLFALTLGGGGEAVADETMSTSQVQVGSKSQKVTIRSRSLNNSIRQ